MKRNILILIGSFLVSGLLFYFNNNSFRHDTLRELDSWELIKERNFLEKYIYTVEEQGKKHE